MKWVLSHASDDIRHWQLQKDSESQLLTINLQGLSLRLAGNARRLFFLEVQGLLQKKLLLRTEYGIAIGEIALTDKPSGQLTLNDHKFFYRQEKNQLQILDGEKQLISACTLPDNFQNKIEAHALLFGFAWFVTADALVEKEVALSATA